MATTNKTTTMKKEYLKRWKWWTMNILAVLLFILIEMVFIQNKEMFPELLYNVIIGLFIMFGILFVILQIVAIPYTFGLYDIETTNGKFEMVKSK